MSGCPYGDLFIYYIEGRLDPGTDAALGPAYLGDWEEEGSSFLFFSRGSDGEVAALVGSQPQLALVDSYKMAWSEWQAQFPEILSIGRFAFTAPWAKEEPPEGSLRVVLDPGMVFGTGTHPTTAHCIEALEAVFLEEPPARVLDLGTGTGILALAAARLGAEKVTAVDLNPLAARTAARNVALNGLADVVSVVHGRAESWVDRGADLLAANIHAAVMKDILARPGIIRKKALILSGLLRSQVGEIRDMLKSLPFRIENTWDRDGTWFTFLAKRR